MRIPTWEGRTVLPGVADAPLQSTNAPSDPLGPALAGAAGVASQTIEERQRHAEAEAHRTNVAASVDATNTFLNQLDDMLRNPDTGFLAQRGMNAVQAAPATLKAAHDAQQQVLQKMANDEQRQLLLEQTNGHLRAFTGDVQGHTLQQRNVFEQDAFATRYGRAVKDAQLHYDAPNVDEYVDAIAPIAAAEADRLGLTGDVKTEHVSQALAAGHTAVLDGYLDAENGSGAAAYFRKVEKELPAKVASQYAQLVRKASADQIGLAVAREWIAKGKRDNGDLNEAVVLDGVMNDPRLTSDPTLFKAATEFASTMLRAGQTAFLGQVQERVRVARSAYEAGKSLSAIPADTSRWLLNNAPEQLRALEEWAREDAKVARERMTASGVMTPEQAALTRTYIKAIDEAIAHPAAFAAMSTDELASRFQFSVTREQFVDLMKMHFDMQSQAASPVKDWMSVLGVKDELLKTARANGLLAGDEAKWKPEDIQVWQRAGDDLSNWAVAFKHRNGKDPSPEEYRLHARQVFMDVTVPDAGWFGRDKTMTRVKAELSGQAYQLQEPPELRPLIDEGVRANKLPNVAPVRQYILRKMLGENPEAPPKEALPGELQHPPQNTKASPSAQKSPEQRRYEAMDAAGLVHLGALQTAADAVNPPRALGPDEISKFHADPVDEAIARTNPHGVWVTRTSEHAPGMLVAPSRSYVPFTVRVAPSASRGFSLFSVQGMPAVPIDRLTRQEIAALPPQVRDTVLSLLGRSEAKP